MHLGPSDIVGAKRFDRFALSPFSVVYWVCLGQRFGCTETILCLVILASRFELALNSPQKVEVYCQLTLRPEESLPVTIQITQTKGFGGRCPSRERP